MATKKAKAIPAQFGPYTVLEKLGDGAMGTVYKAQHQDSGTVVALKVIAEDIACDADLLKRFEQEFEVGRSLNHPHIVRALEYNQDGANIYQVMEFVDGRTLGKRIEEKGKLPEAEAIRLIVQVALALHALHEGGLIHRDVKPDNILISADGIAKLTDLGIVKDTQAVGSMTLANVSMGTPHFMSPEQLADAKNVDHRSDVYGLGATLYMAVTGELPFGTRTVLGMFKVKADDQLIPPKKLVPALSIRTDITVRRALHADPAKRQQTIAEFVEALTGRPLPVPAPASSPGKTKAAPAKSTSGPGPVRGAEPTGVERRVSVRYPSRAEGACHAVGGSRRQRWEGVFQDISASGMGLVLSRRFEAGTVLSVELPGAVERRPTRLLVRVVRAKRAGEGKWLLGCKFARPVSEEEVEALK